MKNFFAICGILIGLASLVLCIWLLIKFSELTTIQALMILFMAAAGTPVACYTISFSRRL